MDRAIFSFFDNLPTAVLFIAIAVGIYTLSKGADILITQAVLISDNLGVSKIIIGATVISLGTTLPETAVSVTAAIRGQPGLALGNGVGSFIANTGFILGVAAIIGTIPIDKNLIKRQGVFKLLSVLLLLGASMPFFRVMGRGNISRISGVVFIVALAIYGYFSVRWSGKRTNGNNTGLPEIENKNKGKNRTVITVLKLAAGFTLVIASSRILIQSVEITAARLGIPESIIAATLVAFGTSLPELMTAINSVRRGHGEIALGNIIGANILNILFVIGVSATVSKGGLEIPQGYYHIQFPALLLMMILFFVFAMTKKEQIGKTKGVILVGTYAVYILASYLLPG